MRVTRLIQVVVLAAGCVAMLGCEERERGTSGSTSKPKGGSYSAPSPEAASAPAPTPALAGSVSLTGSSTVAPLIAELAKKFEAANPGVRINVEMGGSTRGINDARSGQADIGMISRSLKPDETDLTAHLIARDGIAMIVNTGVSVPELTREQIIAIYQGRVANWKEVGGTDQAITVVNKAEGRSTLELFLHHFGLKSLDIKASVVIGDNQQGIKSVSSIPGAIGYVSVGSAEGALAEGVGIRLLPLGGVAATTANVKNRTFPLARELNLVTRGEPGQAARAFIEFCRSPAADATIEELFFVPPR